MKWICSLLGRALQLFGCCAKVPPPPAHLSIALLMDFLKSPVLKTPVRHVLGHPVELLSKWVLSVGLDLV